jgi:phosphatidylglycerophosphate synthase
MAEDDWKRRLPNALSYARMVLTGLMFVAVYFQDKALYVVFVLLAVVTDLLDGPIARRYRVETAEGANLDSISDFAFYLTLVGCTYIWVPDIVMVILPAVVVLAILYTAMLIVSRAVRGLMGYHNRFTRAAATAGVVLGLWLVVFGFTWVGIAAMGVLLVLDLGQRAWNLMKHVRERRAVARSAPSGAATPSARER